MSGQVCQHADKFGIYDIVKENNWLQLTSMQPTWGAAKDAAANVALFQQIIADQTAFETLFPNVNTYFTYAGLEQAIANFPDFCGDNSATLSALDDCKKELAAFLAWVSYTTMGNEGDFEDAKAVFEDGTYIDNGLLEPVKMTCIDINDPTIVLTACDTKPDFAGTELYTFS